MGSVLARYHQAVRSLPLAHAGWLNRRSAAPAASEPALLFAAALALLHAGSAIFDAPLPHGIIHGDFHIGNLLVRSQADRTIVALLDFEEAQLSPLLVDVAFGLFGSHALHYTRRRTQANVHAFLDGYVAIRPLAAAEQDNLALAVRFVAGACALWLAERGYADNAAHNIAVANALQQVDLTR
jgi:Ser/Thr protein kinase RdoA (MazF antagonist)